MAITRDPDYPAETAQLAAAFNRCADGHDVETVLNASVQMVAAAIGFICKQRGVAWAEAEQYTAYVTGIITKEVKSNWDRKQRPTDIAVEAS